MHPINRSNIQQFNEWADSYESGIWWRYFRASYQEITGLLSKEKPIPVLLDIGCGTGQFSISIIKSGIADKVFGIDISQKMIDYAKRNVIISGIATKKIDFINTSADVLPFSNDSCDYVTCLNSFHHYPNPDQVLAEIKRILRNGGKLLILDPFKDNIIRLSWSWILKAIFREGQVSYYSQKEINEILLRNGFNVKMQKRFMYLTLITISDKNAS